MGIVEGVRHPNVSRNFGPSDHCAEQACVGISPSSIESLLLVMRQNQIALKFITKLVLCDGVMILGIVWLIMRLQKLID